MVELVDTAAELFPAKTQLKLTEAEHMLQDT